jgi:hypothetical protein
VFLVALPQLAMRMRLGHTRSGTLACGKFARAASGRCLTPLAGVLGQGRQPRTRVRSTSEGGGKSAVGNDQRMNEAGHPPTPITLIRSIHTPARMYSAHLLVREDPVSY